MFAQRSRQAISGMPRVLTAVLAGVPLAAPCANAGFITVTENSLNFSWTTTVPVIQPGDTWTQSFSGKYDGGSTLIHGTFIATLSASGRWLSLTLTDMNLSSDRGYNFQFDANYWVEFDVPNSPYWIGWHSILGETGIFGNGALIWSKTSRHNLQPLQPLSDTINGPVERGFGAAPVGVETTPGTYYVVHSDVAFALQATGGEVDYVRLPDSALDWAIPSPITIAPFGLLAIVYSRRR